MQRIKWLSLLLMAAMILPASAQQAPSLTPAKIRGVEFTKIQDLDPNAKGSNRPVKQKWAVVIGASRFKEGRLTPGGSQSDDMAESAREFSDYLVDPNGGRFDKSHVKLLLDSAATRQNIMTALNSFLASAAGPDDLVVVYVATSAFPTTDGNTYLCAYDCALENIYGTCISMQTLMGTLRESVPSDRIVLILQSAYSGAANLESGAKALGPGRYNLDLSKVVLGNGFIIMSSSQPNEMTWGSSFSKNLISALRQEGGLVSIDKAFSTARQNTEAQTAAAGPKKKQVPVMKSSWTGTPLVLGAPPVERVANLPASFLSAEGYYLKASNLMADGKTDEAIEQYKMAVVADPKYADALADYGACLAMKDDWQGACDLYKQAIAARPRDELYRINYARVLDKLGDKQNSLLELENAYRLNPKDVSLLKTLASKSQALGKGSDAVRYLEEAVDLYPGKSDLRERLSQVLLKNGDIDQAVAQAKEAVKLDPKSSSARTTLGSILLVQGYVVPAVQSYKDAANLAPDDANIRWLLSRAMEQSGDRTGAIGELEHFIQMAPSDDPRAAKARAHLEELKSRL